MLTIICSIVCLVLGLISGMLIGKKNPSVADEAKKFTDAVKATAEKVK